MKIKITAQTSLYIDKPPEVVWEFTQDYSRRTQWDKSIVKATVIQEKPFRLIDIQAKGNLHMQLKYKLFDPPYKTSLAMTEVRSFFIEGGGGSWQYAAFDAGTLWTQTNTLVLKNHIWSRLLRNIIAYKLHRNTKMSMQRAKLLLAAGHSATGSS